MQLALSSTRDVGRLTCSTDRVGPLAEATRELRSPRVDLDDRVGLVAEVQLIGEVTLDHIEGLWLIVAGISAYREASPCRCA